MLQLQLQERCNALRLPPQQRIISVFQLPHDVLHLRVDCSSHDALGLFAGSVRYPRLQGY